MPQQIRVQRLLYDYVRETVSNFLQKCLSVLVDALVIFLCSPYLVVLRHVAKKLLIQVDCDESNASDGREDVSLGNAWQQFRVDDVPELAALRLVVPVLAQEPAHERHVLHVVLAINEGEVFVQVGRGLRTARLRSHSVHV